MGRFLASSLNLLWKGFPRNYSVGQASKSNLSQLRKRTGVPLKNCREALEKFNNNLEEAEKWLIEEAQKQGWARADKLQSRSMSQGLVGLIQSRTGATMIEVNCETDFVARNEKFKDLVYRLTVACHSNLQKDTYKKSLQQEEVNSLPSENRKLSDIVALEVGAIGENMKLRRAVFLPSSEGQYVNSYVHNSDKKVVIKDCHLGRYGVILSVEKTAGTETTESVEAITTDLAVTGWNTPPFSTERQKKFLFHTSIQPMRKDQTIGYRSFHTTSLRMNDKLTHLGSDGKAKMVDVGAKDETVRTAVACASISLGKKAFSLVEANKTKKGDVLSVAQLAGIMAAKRTSELIPLCHNIGLSKLSVDLSLQRDSYSVYIECEAKAVGKTGVEMEAITGASVAAITVYDMCKAVNKEMVISNIRLLSKTGGKSGEYKFDQC
ncbi:elongation factor Ts-like [Saccostrea echinata]|uniref:elongation factor Ts-like n=1 Tax=Saccostrea echinata TaxID=191078 RepID=UPI002A81C46F|nr:elongation factor Ts-like [Saccostrea echinata]